MTPRTWDQWTLVRVGTMGLIVRSRGGAGILNRHAASSWCTRDTWHGISTEMFVMLFWYSISKHLDNVEWRMVGSSTSGRPPRCGGVCRGSSSDLLPFLLPHFNYNPFTRGWAKEKFWAGLPTFSEQGAGLQTHLNISWSLLTRADDGDTRSSSGQLIISRPQHLDKKWPHVPPHTCSHIQMIHYYHEFYQLFYILSYCIILPGSGERSIPAPGPAPWLRGCVAAVCEIVSNYK